MLNAFLHREISNVDSIESEIKVSWQHRVLFTDNVFDPANPVLRDVLSGPANGAPRKALLVLDEALAQAQSTLASGITQYFAAHQDSLAMVRPPLIIQGGEQAKSSWARVTEILTAIDAYHIDRHSCLITVGGGALLDMTGLAAATAHRGVRHIRIPTTTLSQCDSGVGVKNGINAFGKKNFIGTFSPPLAVINDFQFLTTLDPADKRSGYVEAIKVACIRDAQFFDTLEREADALRIFQPDAMR